jgi:hypothetical protein
MMRTDEVTPEVEAVVLAYVSAWNELDDRRRRELVAQCWSERGVVMGPDTHYAGRDALVDDIMRFHCERPGWRGVLASGIDVHHHMVRFAVAIEDDAGRLVAEGTDIGEIGADGKFVRIVTFWGPPPKIPATWPREIVRSTWR